MIFFFLFSTRSNKSSSLVCRTRVVIFPFYQKGKITEQVRKNDAQDYQCPQQQTSNIKLQTDFYLAHY